MRTSDFDYDLPIEFIAQTPVYPRDASRLLILNRQNGNVQHTFFNNLDSFLQAGDLLVLNETRVIPARLYGQKVPTGGQVEILLLRRVDEVTWETLVGGKGLSEGKFIQLRDGPQLEILKVLDGACRLVRFGQPIEPFLPEIGHVPLPPYIHTPIADPRLYQTVFARLPGSAAAPTAGLHFTPRLLYRLQSQGIKTTKVVLHIGLDTFVPVTDEDPQKHPIHEEWCQLTPEAAETINSVSAAGGRVIAVGTTCVRVLESAARLVVNGERVAPFEGYTGLFILPGHIFRAVDGMITNFHLPRSTLIMLVSAFAGRERILDAYRLAMKKQYRFYSFGDGMLIV